MAVNIEEVRKNLIYSKNKKHIFNSLPKKEQGDVLLNLPQTIQKKLLQKLSDIEITNFLKFLDLDEAANLLRIIDKKRRIKIIEDLEKEAKEKIQLLLEFDKESAAGLMTLDYIQVNIESKLKDVMKIARNHEKNTGKFPIILVTKDEMLKGELPTHCILNIKQNEKITKYIKKIPKILYKTNSREIPKILKEHPHDKLVVIDDEKSILGIIYAHDVLKSLGETRDIEKFAGVKKEENVFDNFTTKTKNRYKWLILNLATAFLAASVVGLFEETISKFVLLAIYMPIVAGMGGNAGTQTLAIFVRGIALKEIELNKQAYKAIMNEIGAGALNGLITGILAAAVALVWNKSPMLGLIIGLAMIINLMIAGLFGALIPLIMKKLGKDPATSATIFITTATDVFGFFAFLGLATLLL
jgi:magnesium transporter